MRPAHYGEVVSAGVAERTDLRPLELVRKSTDAQPCAQAVSAGVLKGSMTCSIWAKTRGDAATMWPLCM